jgi:hypothetical protein
MRPRTRHLLLVAVLAVSACVPPPKPTPAPAPTPVAVTPPAPVPSPVPPTYADWREAPQTPGDWTYADGLATFGAPGNALLSMRCDRAGGAVELVRNGGGAPGPWMVRTETTERPLEGAAQRSDPPSALVRLNPADPVLDAMAFSSGRFALEAPGAPTLYVPSWPEVMRVIDDCR